MRRKSKIAYGNSLTRAFLDHFWYGESISELLLASVPGDHLRFASRARDFRIWNVRLGQPKRDRFRENQDKWTTEMSSPAPNYSKTSWLGLLRSWLSTRTASRIFREKFELVLPVSGLHASIFASIGLLYSSFFDFQARFIYMSLIFKVVASP